MEILMFTVWKQNEAFIEKLKNLVLFFEKNKKSVVCSKESASFYTISTTEKRIIEEFIKLTKKAKMMSYADIRIKRA